MLGRLFYLWFDFYFSPSYDDLNMDLYKVKKFIKRFSGGGLVFVEKGEPQFVVYDVSSEGDSPREETEIGKAKVFPNVRLGRNVIMEDFCVIGHPFQTAVSEQSTFIGDDAVIRSHTVIYSGNNIGNNFQTGHHALIRENNEIGDNVSVGSYANIEHHVKIEDNVRIHSKAFIPEFTHLKRNSWIGPGVIITNASFPRAERTKETLKGAIIEQNAKIGAGVVLLPGIRVGENVPANAVVAGSPAKIIKMISDLRYKDTGELVYPNSSTIQPEIKTKNIPLVDLRAQYQTIKSEIDEAIARVIANSSFIMGKEVENFETELASFFGKAHCVGVSNGTAALEIALRASGIGPGDEVITTPMSFIATTEAIINVGAVPKFCDIEESTFNLDPVKIEKMITMRTKAIVPVHLYGQPADMRKISEIASQRNFLVIEDAAQAHGAEFEGRKVPWQIGSLSFFPGKNLGAFGDAGAVVTDDGHLAKTMGAIRNHGRFDKYEHTLPGANNRIDALQAAILSVKLRYLDKWVEARRVIARRYRENLQNLPLILPYESPRVKHAYHLFVIRTPRRDELTGFLKNFGIATGIHYPIPLHLQPVYRNLGYKEGDFPVTERVSREILSLPIYPELEFSDVDYISEKIKDFFGAENKF